MSRLLVLASVVCAAPLAHAEVELGGMVGGHVFANDNELGVADRPDAPSQRNSVLLGVRVGAWFHQRFGVEAELGVIPTVARETEFTVVDLTYRAQLVAQLRGSDPGHRLLPFVLLGAGAFTVVDSKNALYASDPRRNIASDTDATYYVGAGLKLRGPRIGFRFDARLLVVPSSDNTLPADPDTKHVTADFEALASVYVELGRARREATPPRPRRPVDDDPDRDGFRGEHDQCPVDAEDLDGFLDDDGCPEPDNDADGLLDGDDKCPLEAEDRDAFEDDDGCPDLDNDRDGVSDNTDLCPADPEDADGFEDDDGCPDPDNDQDGVLDAADRCADQPETTNGYLDHDGCPDEIPTKLVKFTGAIRGINFRISTADLSPSSRRTLDAAVAVLREFGDVQLEIGGHTDDTPLRRRSKFADNLELSKARAERVREYLIQKGIDAGRLTAIGFGDAQPVVDPAGLSGAALRAAQAQNRRVEFRLVGANTAAP